MIHKNLFEKYLVARHGSGGEDLAVVHRAHVINFNLLNCPLLRLLQNDKLKHFQLLKKRCYNNEKHEIAARKQHINSDSGYLFEFFRFVKIIKDAKIIFVLQW